MFTMYSVFKFMYDLFILSHLQLGITFWGFESSWIIKLQKRSMRIMTLSKKTHMLNLSLNNQKYLKLDIYDVECMIFWHKFPNDSL